MWVQWKHLTPERSTDLCLQTFPKLLLLLVPKVTPRAVYTQNALLIWSFRLTRFIEKVVQALI
jgi:hypothetical protein